jgi:hypothetical protein
MGAFFLLTARPNRGQRPFGMYLVHSLVTARGQAHSQFAPQSQSTGRTLINQNPLHKKLIYCLFALIMGWQPLNRAGEPMFAVYLHFYGLNDAYPPIAVTYFSWMHPVGVKFLRASSSS